jgi:hypothetical protein
MEGPSAKSRERADRLSQIASCWSRNENEAGEILTRIAVADSNAMEIKSSDYFKID